MRTGNTLTAFQSVDGSAWVQVGSDTIPLSGQVFIGLAVTAHNNSVLNTSVFDNVTVTVGNAPPQVTLTSPLNNATFTAPATITLNATASDVDGTVQRVDFFANTLQIGSASTPVNGVYSFAWTNVVTGNYALTAVATDNSGATATSNVANVLVSTSGGGGGGLPLPWAEQDIDTVGLPGSTSFDSVANTFTVHGSGTDIWGGSDSFHFVYQPLNGDGQITARVDSVQNTNPWAKAGVMIRQNFTPGSIHALMCVTPGNGTSFQRRTTANASSTSTAGGNASAPLWVRLSRVGSTVTASQSPDGATWTTVGSVTLAFSGQVQMGLALSAHNNTVLNTSVFSHVSVVTSGNIPPTVALTSPVNNTSYFDPVNISLTATASDADGSVARVDFFNGTQLIGSSSTPVNGVYSFNWLNVVDGNYTLTAVATDNVGATTTSNVVNIAVLPMTGGGGGLPVPWTDQDIGSVGLAGSASFVPGMTGTFNVKASGTDIWSVADSFHFVSQPVSGNFQVIARVVSVQNTDPWAKAGVMIRQSLAPGSAHAFMAVTPGNGTSFQRRTATNATSTSTSGGNVTAPYWVRLVRLNNTITAYQSTNGVAWTQVGTTTISFTDPVYVGLAVTAHNNAVLNTSSFDNVSVGP